MRQRLGRSTTMVTRDTVYQIDDGFEIESREHYEIVQRRVFFDDVQLVTYHRHLGALYLLAHGAVALIFLGSGLALSTLSGDAWVAGLIVGMFGVPSFIAFVLRLLFRVDVITIFGRRSKATLRFLLRKGRARETYGRICAAVRQAQARSAAAMQPAATPVTPEPPPPAPEWT